MKWGLGIGDWGLGIGDWGLGIGCFTGCETFADADAFGAEPTPASLEYRPLLIP